MLVASVDEAYECLSCDFDADSARIKSLYYCLEVLLCPRATIILSSHMDMMHDAMSSCYTSIHDSNIHMYALYGHTGILYR